MINVVELTMAQINENSDEKPVECTNQSIEKNTLLPGINIASGLSNVLNDEVLFYDVLAMFCQEHGQDGEKFKSAFHNNDIATLKHLAHTLKGVSASIAALELHNKTKLLDDLIHCDNQEQQNLSLYLEDTYQELTLVLEGIQRALQQKPTLGN